MSTNQLEKENMLYFIPFIAAILGWVIQSLVVKILFRPRFPVKLGGFSFQGIIPASRENLTTQIAELVDRELLNFQGLKTRIADPSNVQKLLPLAETHIDHFLKVKLAEKIPMISMFIGEQTQAQLKSIFMEELSTLLPEIISQYAAEVQSSINIKEIISEKLTAIPTEKIEQFINVHFSRGLLYLKLSGAVLGFIIGLFQLGLLLISGNLS